MVYYRPDVEKFARSVVATLTSSPMAVPNTSQSDFGDSSLSLCPLTGREKQRMYREQGTQHCATLHPMAHTLPLPFLTKSIAPPPTALSPTPSRKFCIDLMAGWVGRLFCNSRAPLAPLLCMPCVCCSLICFSTPLRTVDCVQYNSVLWPTLASLLLLQSSDFTASARKWRQWAPPPTAPQLLLCTPTTPLT